SSHPGRFGKGATRLWGEPGQGQRERCPFSGAVMVSHTTSELKSEIQLRRQWIFEVTLLAVG
ncbi:MAG: hypothetical protein WAK25_01290, partial [Acidobacteriaceae bacterium]